jgi:hypothetical protein
MEAKGELSCHRLVTTPHHTPPQVAPRRRLGRFSLDLARSAPAIEVGVVETRSSGAWRP